MRLPTWVNATETRVRERTDAVQTWVERTIWWRVWERVLENEFVDRSVALAAKAFVSLFPAIIVVAAFAPPSVRTSIYHTITHRAGLSGPGLQTVKGAFASADDVRRATGILGLVFTFFYINSFTTALQRVYTRAWRRPPGGRVSGYALGASWLVAILIYLAVIGVARALIGGGPKIAAYAVIAMAASIALWWISPWLMLGRQVRLRVLLPTGVLTGIAMSVYAASASLWMPRSVTENQTPVRVLRCCARDGHLAQRHRLGDRRERIGRVGARRRPGLGRRTRPRLGRRGHTGARRHAFPPAAGDRAHAVERVGTQPAGPRRFGVDRIGRAGADRTESSP